MGKAKVKSASLRCPMDRLQTPVALMLDENANVSAAFKEMLNTFYAFTQQDFVLMGESIKATQYRITLHPHKDAELIAFLEATVPRGKMAEFLRCVAYFQLGRNSALDIGLLAKQLSALISVGGMQVLDWEPEQQEAVNGLGELARQFIEEGKSGGAGRSADAPSAYGGEDSTGV